MTLTPPLVSVLVPTYNGERFIEATLHSARHQTWENLEIVVVDDCSSDRTVDIVSVIASRDERIRLIRNPTNLGAWRNTSEIAGHTKGQYLKFLLQDDVLHPEAVARLVAPLIADPTLALSTSKRGLIDDNGRRLNDVPATEALANADSRIPGRLVGDTVLIRGLNTVGELSTTMLRSEAAMASTWWWWGTRQFAANGDLWLWLQLLTGGDLWYVADELSSFRQHATQRSQDHALNISGFADWPDLVAAAKRLGYLAEPDAERAAWARILSTGALFLGRLSRHDDRELVARSCQIALDAMATVPGRFPLDDVELVYRPAWNTAGAVERGVAAYLDAFRPDDPVSLVVVADPTGPDAVDLDATLTRIVRSITDRGRDPDDIPEIVLVHAPGPLTPGRRRVVLCDEPAPGPDDSETVPTPPTVPRLRAAAATRAAAPAGEALSMAGRAT